MAKIKIQKIFKNITFKKSLELKEAIIDAKTAKAILGFVVYDSSVRKKALIEKKLKEEEAAKSTKEAKK